jgi:hypothetical protein
VSEAIIALFVVGLFLPSLIGAGDLEPPSAPGPTMKTLDQIPPTWSQIIPGKERFEVVMGGEAVLDKETGLVWEQSPDATSKGWSAACRHCFKREIANRFGWRLPSVEELASLIDNDNYPPLPADHPFSLPEVPSFYWSATPDVSTGNAWVVDFTVGSVEAIIGSPDLRAWCVRGGHGHDAEY